VAEKHPYAPGNGGLTKAINQLRKAFPAQVTAETLKKLGIAPNNESYVINILKFVGVIDQDGKRTSQAQAAFSKHSDQEFHKAFEPFIQEAYAELFQLHGAGSWNLDQTALISFFRAQDNTSAVVGQRQASTFQALAAFAGHGQVPATKVAGSPSKAPKPAPPAKAERLRKPDVAGNRDSNVHARDRSASGFGLTVRVEVNLPASDDQAVYDAIFKSIKENLLRG
jgi:hypothetical protein